MKDINEMNINELDELFENVIISMMSDSEKFVLYDAIEDRKNKLQIETAKIPLEEIDLDDFC